MFLRKKIYILRFASGTPLKSKIFPKVSPSPGGIPNGQKPAAAWRQTPQEGLGKPA